MLIDCPECSRSYHLVAADLGPRGRVVICPRCDARWFQRSEEAAGIDAAPWAVATLSSSVRAAEVAPDIARPAERKVDHRALTGGRMATPDHVLRRLRAAVAVLMIGGAAIAGIAARRTVVRIVPRSAAIYAAIRLPVNLRGLQFAKLTPLRAAAEITLAGEIRNVAHARVRLPRLVFEVRDDTGAPLMQWSESPPASTLAAGRAVTFASPPRRVPAEGRTILVRFEDPARFEDPVRTSRGEPGALQQVAVR